MSLDALDFLDAAQQIKVKKRPWMGERKFVLGTKDNLAQIMGACIASPRFALDLETSGLDNRALPMDNGILCTVDRIAGVCLSADGVTGYYIPLRHIRLDGVGSRTPHPANIPEVLFEREFRRLIRAVTDGVTVAIFHNGKFDQEFLQHYGGSEPFGEWDKAAQWEDTLILAYLRNSRERSKGLKTLSKVELGIEQVELEELFPPGTPEDQWDFTTLDPTDTAVLWYTGGDGICTYLLYDKLIHATMDPDSDGKTQRGVYQIEKSCVPATRWMERCQVHVGMEKTHELMFLGQQEWLDAIWGVYQEIGTLLGRDIMPGKYKVLRERFEPDNPKYTLKAQLERAAVIAKTTHPSQIGKITRNDGRAFPAIYDVNSPQQLGTLFDELGVPGLVRTEKSGQIKTAKEELDRIIEASEAEFAFMKRIKYFREVSKALASNIFPMITDCDPTYHTMRINFNAHKTDTGRFSTPAKDDARKRMVGWPQINLQSIPRSSYDPDRPACMTRLRECITARKPDAFIVAIDFSGVELRIVTNLSLEPKWLTEFSRCSGCGRVFEPDVTEGTPSPPPPRCPNCGSDKIGDLHTLTAISIFGEDAPTRDTWKSLRGQAKASNFALCYGGGGGAVARSTGVNKNEGWRIANVFTRTYLGLKKWWAGQHKFARQHGFVRTVFGRKYPVPDITSPDGGFRSKAERNSVNGPVQGSSADITKIAMALAYKEMKKRGWLNKVKMIICMHDEIVFEIDADVIAEAIPVLYQTMTRNPLVLGLKWPVPLTCDIEIGRDWTVPWDLTAIRHGEVRFIGDKKIKGPDKVPEGYRWEDLPHWPESLIPYFPEAQGDTKRVTRDLAATTDKPASNKGDFEYRMLAPLTTATVEKLASVIARCRNRGTRPLTLVTAEGVTLDLAAAFGEGGVLVNHVLFSTLAADEGL